MTVLLSENTALDATFLAEDGPTKPDALRKLRGRQERGLHEAVETSATGEES